MNVNAGILLSSIRTYDLWFLTQLVLWTGILSSTSVLSLCVDVVDLEGHFDRFALSGSAGSTMITLEERQKSPSFHRNRDS